MTDREIPVALRVVAARHDVAVITALRRMVHASMSELRNALIEHTPIAVARICGLDHDEVERQLLTFLSELDDLGAEYEIIIDGTQESREYLNNILQRWRDIGIETGMFMDLESGEPCIETLEWLKRTSPPDDFRMTLEQIVAGDGYDVDAETLAWVRQQLETNDA